MSKKIDSTVNPATHPLAGIAPDLAGMGDAMAQSWKSLAGLSVPPAALAKLQSDYVEQATALWNQTLTQSKEGAAPDRRFAGQGHLDDPHRRDGRILRRGGIYQFRRDR